MQTIRLQQNPGSHTRTIYIGTQTTTDKCGKAQCIARTQILIDNSHTESQYVQQSVIRKPDTLFIQSALVCAILSRI